MVIVDFLRQYPKNRFDLIHFNHGTESCSEAEEFLREFAKENSLEIHVGRISNEMRRKDESQEEYWRRHRYAFFRKFSDKPILLAHHLNDCIETFVMTALQGRPLLIPYANPKYNIIRPFLLTPKSEITDWSTRHHIPFVTDASNNDLSLRRNYVRKVMMPHILHVNPGIAKTVSRLIRSAYAEQSKAV